MLSTPGMSGGHFSSSIKRLDCLEVTVYYCIMKSGEVADSVS